MITKWQQCAFVQANLYALSFFSLSLLFAALWETECCYSSPHCEFIKLDHRLQEPDSQEDIAKISRLASSSMAELGGTASSGTERVTVKSVMVVVVVGVCVRTLMRFFRGSNSWSYIKKFSPISLANWWLFLKKCSLLFGFSSGCRQFEIQYVGIGSTTASVGRIRDGWLRNCEWISSCWGLSAAGTGSCCILASSLCYSTTLHIWVNLPFSIV